MLQVAAGCRSDGEPAGGDETTGGPASTSSAESTGGGGQGSLPPRPDEPHCRFDGPAPGLLPALEVVPAFGGQTFSDPVDLVAVPGDPDRLLLAEAQGRVVSLLRSDPDAAPATVLDLPGSRIVALAPAPTFAADGHLYVRYVNDDTRTLVMRFTVGADGVAPASSGRAVLSIPHTAGARVGGGLRFGPDAMLYIALGDGAVDEPGDVAQDLHDRFGSILRLDVAQLDTMGAQAPPDNPFYDDGGYAAQVWAFGVRDPQHCNFDPSGGALWCGDVGAQTQEVSLAERGANLGWPWLEGNRCVFEVGDCDGFDVEGPKAAYPNLDGDCAVVGGAVYRGAQTSELDGALVYADRCSHRLRAVRVGADGVVEQRRLVGEHDADPVAFGQDADGELYLLDAKGRVGHVVAVDADGEFPERISQSGCFTDTLTLTSAPDLVPYEINAPLWSDGVLKRRHIALPPGSAIGIGPDAQLEFPEGTILLKSFLTQTAPIETRVMVRRRVAWEFHTYRWGPDGDAVLLQDAQDIPVNLEHDGHTVTVDYRLPGRSECASCHGFHEGRALGPRLDQLDRVVDYDDGTANQLDAMASIGLFADPLPAERAPMADPSDDDAPTEARARAYLHTNCGHCHRPGGWVPPNMDMDLRWSTSLASTRTCNVAVQFYNAWVDGEHRIAAGNPDDSVIWERISVRGDAQMPPGWSALVDPGAVVVRDFIASLTSCPSQ